MNLNLSLFSSRSCSLRSTYQVFMSTVKPRVRVRPPRSKLRRACFAIVSHPKFDSAVLATVGLNVFVLTFEHYGQSQRSVTVTRNGAVLRSFYAESNIRFRKQFMRCLFCSWTTSLTALNALFVAMFVIEASLKLIAMSPLVYLRSDWNKYDGLVTVLSVIDLGVQSDVSTAIILGLRIGRFARVFWMFQSAREIGQLFNTLLWSIPALWNIALLVFIVFYIFAIMGTCGSVCPNCARRLCQCAAAYDHRIVDWPFKFHSYSANAKPIQMTLAGVEYFGDIPYSNFEPHYGFNTFGIALNSIFREITKISWENIMYTCRQFVDTAPIYFIALHVVGGFIMVNLFIAAILVSDMVVQQLQLNLKFQLKLTPIGGHMTSC